MGISTWVIGGSTRRTRSFPLAGRWLPAGAVLAGLVVLGGAVPASAQTLTWSVLHSPNRRANGNYLDAVSCVSATVCMATGHRLNSGGSPVTLAESWDGTRWSLVPSPSPGIGYNQVNGVSCASKDACSVVGYYNPKTAGTRILVESWDGSRWSLVPTPNPGIMDRTLNGVSCASKDACMAAGYFYSHRNYRTLIESGTATG